MAGNWKHLKDALAFSSFLVCWNLKRVLLTSDLLPNISPVVDQSSVNISPALGYIHFIGVGRFRILGGPRFRILGRGGARGAKFPAGT